MARRGRPWYREILIGNWKNKAVALFLAIVVWSVSYQNTEITEPVIATLTLAPAQEGLMVVSKTIVEARDKTRRGEIYPDQVELLLRGQRHDVEGQEGRIVGRLLVEEGEVNLEDPNAFSLPFGLEVVATDPSVVEVDLDVVAQEAKKIRPLIVGKPEAPYVLNITKVQADPPQVVVRGPVTEVEKISFIATMAHDITGYSQARFDYMTTLDPESLPENVRFEGVPPDIRVTGTLEKDEETSEAREIPVYYTKPSGRPFLVVNEDISTEEVKLTVKGTAEQVRQWNRNVDSGRFFVLIVVTNFTVGVRQSPDPKDFRYPAGMLAGTTPVDHSSVIYELIEARPPEEGQ